MNLIAAVDSNWAIGNKGQLLARIPDDLGMFRKKTLEKVVVYGRKTLETFPKAQPLDRRTNIVLSGNKDCKADNAVVVHSIHELLEELKAYPSEDIYIIGGESVYRQMLSYCDTAYITKIDRSYTADAHFPNLDADPEWEVAEDGDNRIYSGLTYRFICYRRKNSTVRKEGK